MRIIMIALLLVLIEPVPFQVDYCEESGYTTGVRSYFFQLFWNIEPILLED